MLYNKLTSLEFNRITIIGEQNMEITLHIHDTIERPQQRCLNCIKLYFSLDGELEYYLNGSAYINEGEILIINHGDLYQIERGQQVVELTLPLNYLLSIYPKLLNAYLDNSLLQNHDYLKYLILKMFRPQTDQQASNQKLLEEMLSILKRETLINYNYPYLPHVRTNHSTLNQIIKYINYRTEKNVTIGEISQAFFVSSSYISLLFKRILHISFKDYISSLKVALSLQPLLSEKHSLAYVAEQLGYHTVNNFTRHFKEMIGLPPHQFRSRHAIAKDMTIHVSKVRPNVYHEFIKRAATEQPLMLNYTTINLTSSLNAQETQSFKTFIHVKDLNDLFSQIFINEENMQLSSLTNPYIILEEAQPLIFSEAQRPLLLKYIDKHFNQNIGFALTLHTPEEVQGVESLIAQLYLYKPSYLSADHHVKLMLIYDASEMAQCDIERSIKSLRESYPQIQFALKLEDWLKQVEGIKQAADDLKQLNCDYYSISIDQSETLTLLQELHSSFHHCKTPIDYFDTLSRILDISSGQWIHQHITKLQFINAHNPTEVHLSEMITYVSQLLARGISVSFDLKSSSRSAVALLNHHGIQKPITHIYQFLKPFVNTTVHFHSNYLIGLQGETIHLLLFNTLNQRRLSTNVQRFKLINPYHSASLRFTQTLNRDHGFIDDALPEQLQHTLIDDEILKHMRLSNTPKSELVSCDFNREEDQIVELYKDEIKYIRIFPPR